MNCPSPPIFAIAAAAICCWSPGFSLSNSAIPGMPDCSAIVFVIWNIAADIPRVPISRIKGCTFAESLNRSWSSSKISSNSSTLEFTDSDHPVSLGRIFAGRRCPNISLQLSTPDANVISIFR